MRRFQEASASCVSAAGDIRQSVVKICQKTLRNFNISMRTETDSVHDTSRVYWVLRALFIKFDVVNKCYRLHTKCVTRIH